MRIGSLAVLMAAVICMLPVAKANEYPADPVWGSDWITGDYHQHDLQLSQRVGLSLDWQGAAINGLSLSYTPSLSKHEAAVGLSREEPLTFRLTLRGFELLEANTERAGADFLSFDRIRDRDIRKQLVMISISKRF